MLDARARGLAYHSGLDVTIGEVDVAPVQIQGPESRAVMAGLFGETILDLPYDHLSGDLELAGMRVRVSRSGYTGELGYEIYLYDATADGTRLWNAVLEAGRPHGLQVTGPCHIRRIEGGILAFGCDMWYDTNPFEVDMGYTWMVDLGQEAGFVGKQALQRIKGRRPAAQAGRRRDRRAVGRHLHRQRDDRDVPGAA